MKTMAANRPSLAVRLKDYREIVYFLAFTGFCMLIAANRGFWSEFSSAEAFLVVFGVILLEILSELGGNRRVLLCVLMLMTVGNLVRGAMYANYIHTTGYRGARRHIVAALLVIFVVLFLYGRVYRVLSSKAALIAMFVLSQACYVLMRLGGSEYGGAIISFHGLNLLEIEKILFIFVTAGLLCKRRPDEKARNRAVWLSIGNMILHAGWLVMLSDLGTLIIIGFVYIIFLFIFPNRLRFAAGVLIVLGAAFMAVMSLGSRIYERTLMGVPAQVFASAFTDEGKNDVRTVDNVYMTWDEALREMAASHLEDEALTGNPELYAGYTRACRMLGLDAGAEEGAGEASEILTKADFENAYHIKVDDCARRLKKGETIDWRQDYPAAVCITGLCSYAPFRSDYIDQYLRSSYQVDVRRIFNNYHSGIFHFPESLILSAYDKAAQRLGSAGFLSGFSGDTLGFETNETPYQIGLAMKAMRIGGWTGAGVHEFVYVPIMTTDMVYSQVISQFGFIMGLFVILLYMILFREGVGIERRIDEDRAPYHKGLVLGLSLMLFIQALVIIGGNLNVFPLTGITLPFIAEGGVSLVVCSAMTGILLSASVMKLQEDEMTDRYVRGILTGFMARLGITMDQLSERFFEGLDRVDLSDEDLMEPEDEAVPDEDPAEDEPDHTEPRKKRPAGGLLDDLDDDTDMSAAPGGSGNTFTEGDWDDDDL